MSNATEYDFASVGDTLPTLRERERADIVRPDVNINIKTPLSLGYGKGGLFVMNTTMRDAIADNLKNLLLTNAGERPMNPGFGANLKPLLADIKKDKKCHFFFACLARSGSSGSSGSSCSRCWSRSRRLQQRNLKSGSPLRRAGATLRVHTFLHPPGCFLRYLLAHVWLPFAPTSLK